MAKGDDFGAGLTKDLFSKIVGQLSGGGAKGTVAEQAAVLLELAREENAALRPGKGTTSRVDAILKYIAVAQAVQALSDAPAGAGAAQTAALTSLAAALQQMGKQWTDFGPVADDFLDSEKDK